jgi:VanZ family protein
LWQTPAAPDRADPLYLAVMVSKYARLTATLLFWPYLAGLVFVSLMPKPPELEGPWAWDKLDHFTAYLVLAILARAIGLPPGRTVASAMALGGVLEILQGFTGRSPELGDFIANSLGAVAGIIASLIFLRLSGPRPLVGNLSGD